MLISPIYQSQPRKMQTAVSRYNRIVTKRKVRIASFVPVPRLVKHDNQINIQILSETLPS